jgi:hypothetical protein
MRFAYIPGEVAPIPILREKERNLYLADDFGKTPIPRADVRIVNDIPNNERDYLKSHYAGLQEKAWINGNMRFGTPVEILPTDDFDLGWPNRWTSGMDITVGCFGEVVDVSPNGGILVRVPGPGRYWYPYYALMRKDTNTDDLRGPMNISVVDYESFVLVLVVGGTVAVAKTFAKNDNICSENSHAHVLVTKRTVFAKRLAKMFMSSKEITAKNSALKAAFTKKGIIVAGQTGETGMAWLRQNINSRVIVTDEKTLLRNENGETEKAELEVMITLTRIDINDSEETIEESIERILIKGGRT